MSKPPKIVIPGLNRGAGIPPGFVLGRLPGTGQGPAQLLNLTALRRVGLATSAGVVQSTSQAVSTALSMTTSLSTAIGVAGDLTLRAESYGAVGDAVMNAGTGAWTGTDDTAAFNSMFTALAAAGGGKINLQRKNYLLSSRITLPNDGYLSGLVPSRQVPITIEGQGNWTTCEAGADTGITPKGTNLVLGFQDAAGWTGVGARLQGLGRGHLALRRLNIVAGGPTSVASTPLILVTNTSISYDETVTFVGPLNKQGASADCDAVVGGGLTTTIDNTNTSPFQGYASRFGPAFHHSIRMGVYGRTYFSSQTIDVGTFWTSCGSNRTDGAAIELEGGLDTCTNNKIRGGTIELVAGYKFAVRLKKSAWNIVDSVGAYDAGTQVLGVVLCESDSYDNIIIPGMALSAYLGAERPHMLDRAAVTTGGVTRNANWQLGGRTTAVDQPTFSSINTLFSQQPNPGFNKMGYTEFYETLGGGTVFQPGGPASTSFANVALTVKRGGAAVSSPGAVVWSIDQNGAQIFNDANSAQSGNVTVAAAGQVAYSGQGKIIGFPGRAGGNMSIDTGTGGSFLDLKAFGTRLYDHTGVLGVKIDQQRGGAGLAGIVFGSASDVELYRTDATNLTTSQNFGVASGKVFKVNAVQVVGPRDTGWTADTGTAKKTATATYVPGATLTYGAAYVQAEQTATATRLGLIEAALRDATQEIMALKATLTTHGLIGT